MPRSDTEWTKFDALKGAADWDAPSYGKELYDHTASPVPKPDFNYENVNVRVWASCWHFLHTFEVLIASFAGANVAQVVDNPEHAELVKGLAAQLRKGWRAALPPSA